MSEYDNLRESFINAYQNAEWGNFAPVTEFTKKYGERALFSDLLMPILKNDQVATMNELYRIAGVVSWIPVELAMGAKWKCFHRGLWGADYKVTDLGIDFSRDMIPNGE